MNLQSFASDRQLWSTICLGINPIENLGKRCIINIDVDPFNKHSLELSVILLRFRTSNSRDINNGEI